MSSLFAVVVAAAARAAGPKKQVLAMAPSGSRRVLKYGGATCLVDAFAVVAAASEVRSDRPTALAAGGYWLKDGVAQGTANCSVACGWARVVEKFVR